MSSADTLALKDPEQLYQDWERAHWASQDVDLSARPGATGPASRRASATSSTSCSAR